MIVYATLHILMGQWSLKHVRVDVPQHCDSDKLCVFVGLHCGHWISMCAFPFIFAHEHRSLKA